MGKKRTDKSKYPSRYSPGGFVTAAQWLIECCAERLAKQKGKELPTKFWQLPEWKNFFAGQSQAANTLLKEHGEEAVIKAFKRSELNWMWSLRSPQFRQYILEERRNISLKKQVRQERPELEQDDSLPVTTKQFTPNSKSKKLKEL